MQLLALDAGFQPVAYLPYFNLQWTREYYAVGQFSVQIAAADYLPAMAHLYTPDRPETGVIQKVELAETVKGQFVQLSGYFLESILNDKVVWPTYYANGPLPAAVAAMLRQYKDDIPLLSIDDPPAAQAGSGVSWQETGGQLADVAYTRLRTEECSLRCRYDYQTGTIAAQIWQGADRTQSQTDNPFVTFSGGFGNLAEADTSIDRSNYKNYAVVAGQDQAENRKTAIADLSGGGYRRVLYVDARNLQWDPEKQTEEEYLAALQQKGVEQLLEHQIVRNVEIQAGSGSFVYLQDWDLGDKVDVIVESIGLAMEARIVTVREVFKHNNHTVEIELGNKKLTQLQKARLIH